MAGREGTRLGDYELIERIGGGGMAEVYRARQLTAFGREVALKVVRADLSESEEFRARFLREAQAISRLSHPHILPLIEFGDEDGTLYLVTPLVRGGTLRDLLKQRSGPLPLVEAGQFFIQLCHAVQYAHDEGIIHRDIKPQNILLQQGMYALLADFGIARDRRAAQITATMSGIGTVDYMAPEQAVGQASAQSDIYSLGVVLYQMLTGRLPFEGSTPYHILAKHSSEPLPDPREYKPNLEPGLVEILQTAMAKHPGERFQSASALGNAVQQVMDAAAGRSRSSLPGLSPGAGVSQEGGPPGISVSLPTIDLTPPEQARTDALATRPEPGAGGSPGEPEGRPPGISVPLPDTRPGAPAQSAAFQTMPESSKPQQTQPVPPASPSQPSTQPTFAYAPPAYSGPGVAAPPATYTPGPLPPAQQQKKMGRVLLFGLLAVVVVVGGVSVLLVNVLHLGSGTTGGQTPTPAPTPTIPPGFQRYISPDHTFSIIYPAGWGQSAAPLGAGAEFDGPSGQMFTVANNGPGNDVAAGDDEYCLLLTGSPQPRKQITLGGQAWLQEECASDLLGVHGVIEGISYKGNLYLINYQGPLESSSSDRLKYFAPMERSFTFLT